MEKRHLSIKSTGPTRASIKLNGIDLSHYARRFVLEQDAGDVPILKIEILCFSTDIDLENLVIIPLESKIP